VSAAPPPDLAAIRHVLSRATGTGWEAAYRQDVGALLDALAAALARGAEAEANHKSASSILAGWRHKALRMERERDDARTEERAAERAAVVAWLRSLQPHNTDVVAVYLQMLADVIERGEHRREEQA
jgi:hypothetical protein